MKELLNRLDRLYRIRKEKILLILGAVMTMGILASCECESDTSPKSPNPTSVGFKGTSLTLEEDAGTIDVTVEIEEALTGDINLNVSTMDMSASSGLDYTAISEMEVIISEGDTSITFPLTILDDGEVEEDETFKLVLSASGGLPSDLNFGNQEAMVTINNDDMATLSLSRTPPRGNVEEGGSVTLTASLSGGKTLAIDLPILIEISGNAESSDYGFPSGMARIIIPAGTSEGMVELNIEDDLIIEPEETLNVSMNSGAINTLLSNEGLIDSITIDNPPVEIVIMDTDMASLGFTAPAISLVEGDSGSTPVTLTVSLSGDQLVEPLSITVATVDGTATNGEDYTAVNQTLTFPPMTNFHEIDIPIMITGDNRWGVDETFQVELSATDKPAGVTLGEPATVTIMNDDTVDLLATYSINSRGELNPDIGTRNIPEDAGSLELYFFIQASSGATESDMIINLVRNMDFTFVASGSVLDITSSIASLATLGDDFTAPSPSTVIFPSGSLMTARQTVTIGVIHDALNEGNEVLSYRIITQPDVNLVPLSAFTDRGGTGVIDEANNNARFAVIVHRPR